MSVPLFVHMMTVEPNILLIQLLYLVLLVFSKNGRYVINFIIGVSLIMSNLTSSHGSVT